MLEESGASRSVEIVDVVKLLLKEQSCETCSTVGRWRQSNSVRRHRCNWTCSDDLWKVFSITARVSMRSEHEKARLTKLMHHNDIEAYLSLLYYGCIHRE